MGRLGGTHWVFPVSSSNERAFDRCVACFGGLPHAPRPPARITHHPGGSCNSSFNGRAHSFHKSRRIKARHVKKAVCAKDKHLAELAARKDTKKVQKRRARDKRLREKEAKLVEASMDVDGQVKGKKTANEQLGLALKKVGAGRKKYSQFLKNGGAKGTRKEQAGAVDRMEE